MTDQANPGDKGLRILLEALTTISYLKRDEGRAAAIAEYALDQYENALGHDGASVGVSEDSYLPALLPEQRVALPSRDIDRRCSNDGLPAGLMERRLNVDRRVSPDRRGQPPAWR